MCPRSFSKMTDTLTYIFSIKSPRTTNIITRSMFKLGSFDQKNLIFHGLTTIFGITLTVILKILILCGG